MIKRATICLILLFFISLSVPGGSWSQKADPTITGFKVEALYRAAKLTWKTKGDLKNEMAVQILRANGFEDGDYQEIGVVKILPGKSAYEYVDKGMGAEAKYYYKLVIKDSNEFFGPLPTRPFFSPPAT